MPARTASAHQHLHPVTAVLSAFSKDSYNSPPIPYPGLPHAALLLAEAHGVDASATIKDLPILHRLASHTPRHDDNQGPDMASLAAMFLAAGADPFRLASTPIDVDAFELAMAAGNLDVLQVLLRNSNISASELASRPCQLQPSAGLPAGMVRPVPWLHVLATGAVPNAQAMLQYLIENGADRDLAHARQHPLATASVSIIQMYRSRGWFPENDSVLASLKKAWRNRLVTLGVKDDLLDQLRLLLGQESWQKTDMAYETAIKKTLATPLGEQYQEPHQKALCAQDKSLDKTISIESGALAGMWNTVGALCYGALRGYDRTAPRGRKSLSPLSFLPNSVEASAWTVQAMEKSLRQCWRPGLPFCGLYALALAASSYRMEQSVANARPSVARVFFSVHPDIDAFIKSNTAGMCNWLLSVPSSLSLSIAGLNALLCVHRQAGSYRPPWPGAASTVTMVLPGLAPWEKLARVAERFALIQPQFASMRGMLLDARAFMSALGAVMTAEQAGATSGTDMAWHADIVLTGLLIKKQMPASLPSMDRDSFDYMKSLQEHPVWSDRGDAFEAWSARLSKRCSDTSDEDMSVLLARLTAERLRRRADAAPAAPRQRMSRGM